MANSPQINGVYLGYVASIDLNWFNIRVTGFDERFEGIIYKTLVDRKSAAKLNRGRLVKVKIIASFQDFVVINLESIEDDTIRMNDRKEGRLGRDSGTDRVNRIARYEKFLVMCNLIP